MVFLFVFAASCKKESVEPVDQDREAAEAQLNFRNFSSLIPNEESSVNEVRLIVAQTLAQALQNSQVRAYIHQKMQWAYDTDYEMIYIAEKDSIVFNNTRLADVLKNVADPQVLSQYGQDFFDRVAEISPMLTITAPDWDSFNGDNWDVNVVPNVTAVLENAGSYNLKMYNSQGDTVSVAYESNGDGLVSPTLGVWEAEGYYLLKTDGTLHSGVSIDQVFPKLTEDCNNLLNLMSSGLPGFQCDGQQYYLVEHNDLREEYYNCVGGISPTPIIPDPIDCPPGCEAKLWMESLNIPDWFWYCDCDDGSGEEEDPCAEECDRDCEEENEKLVDFKIDGWSAFELIRNQPFESKYSFHGRVGAATRTDYGNLVELGPVERLDPIPRYVSGVLKQRHLLDCRPRPCSGRWIKADYDIVGYDWTKERMGDKYTVSWYEVDGTQFTLGLEVKLEPKFKVGPAEVSAGSVAVDFELTGSDVIDLGNQRVNYCEPIMDPRYTGTVYFRCN